MTRRSLAKALDGHTHRDHESTVIPPTRWQIVAVIAAGLTAAAPLLPDNTATFVLTLPLSFGVLFGSAFFGGLHNGPPAMPVFALAAAFNAVVWGGAFRLTRWGRRRVGKAGRAAIDIY
jgi:hypothetical protein